MRPKFRTLFLCLFLMASVLGLSAFAKDDPNATQKTRLEKSKGTLQKPGEYMMLNINNWILYLMDEMGSPTGSGTCLFS